MTARDLDIADLEGLEREHQQRVRERKFAEVEYPCSATQDWAMLIAVAAFVGLMAVLGMWLAS